MRKSLYIFTVLCILAGTRTILGPASSQGSQSIQRAVLPAPTVPSPAAPALANRKAVRRFGGFPVYFTPNAGQMDAAVDFYVQGKDKAVYFSPSGVTYALRHGEARCNVKMDFLGANPGVKPLGLNPTGAVISYFKGKPEEWKAGLPAYSRIIYKDLWPGIDLVYRGEKDKLKYEFVVHPGADPATVRLLWRGAERIRVDENGRLDIETPAGSFVDETPAAYQEADRSKIDVAMSYELCELPKSGANPAPGDTMPVYSCGFTLGAYDKTRDLVLDPATLVYCGFIGGNGYEEAFALAVDMAGCAYITGTVSSWEPEFPVTVAPDLMRNGGDFDAFVAKINAAGTALVYCGYIGGSGEGDVGNSIAVDGSGNAYVAGYTDSDQSSFPVKIGPNLTYNGAVDAFVAKINAAGTALDYCGYVGGISVDHGYGIAVDGSGNAYVSGDTYSTEGSFPEHVGPRLIKNGTDNDADAFVAKVKADGTALDYCGYIGGVGGDYGRGIAVDSSGNAYVTGYTYSDETTFPVLVGPGLTHNLAFMDAFVAKVNATGTALVYCGYISGSKDDYGYGIAVDNSGHAYVTGDTSSSETQQFPVAGGPDSTHNGSYDAFVAKVKADGTALSYCGYIGGSGNDRGRGIGLDGSGNAYVAGYTDSNQTTFPEIVGPDLTQNGNDDAFVAKINDSADIAVTKTSDNISPSFGASFNFTVTVTNNGPLGATGLEVTDSLPAALTYISSTPSQGTYSSVTGIWDIGTLANAATATLTIAVKGTSSGAVTNTASVSGLDQSDPDSSNDSASATVTVKNIYALTINSGAGGTTSPVPGPYTYDEGTVVSISATPSAGYRLGNWTGDASGSTSPISVTMNANKTVTANFVRQYTLTIAAGAGGTTSPVPGTYTYDEGTVVNVTVAASSGYRFNGWSGDASGFASPLFVTMNANKTITANFVRQYALTIAAGAGGTTNPVPGTYTYDEGTIVSVSATPSAGYRLGDWTGDASGSASPISVTLSANKSVKANFIRQYTLTIAAGAGGTTSPVSGTYTYDEGASVSVTAAPSAGYRFGGWTGDASGTASPISITINANKTVTANFIRRFNLTIIAGTGGSTNPVPGVYTYDEGAIVNITATAAAGYRFVGWTGDASGSTSPISVTMNADKTVTANFIRRVTLTIIAGAGGTTNPVPGTYTYDEGVTVSVLAEPFSSFEFEGWSGAASGTANPISILMNGNKTITASFTRAVKPVLGLTAEKQTNRNVSTIETVVRLRWQPNSANMGTIRYRIYRIDNGAATAIAEVGAGTYEYLVRGLQASRAYQFGVTAVNGQGWESDMAVISVQ